ncbi:MAG TPA: right-handed parallel beta-helix repeat-containing protein [Spirochaetota bacterium]|nr:right-handed parallel beta-helix repeat-containing protein [Spirochaetota bacterium]
MKRTASFLIPCTVFILSLFLLSCDDDSDKKSSSGLKWASGYPTAAAVVDTVSITGQDISSTARTNKDCTVYYVAVSSGDPAPSADQIIAGQNGSGAAAFNSGNQAITALTNTVLTMSSFPYSTAYDIYIIGENTTLNQRTAIKNYTVAIGERNIIFVRKTGNDSNTGLDPMFPKLTIQAGVTAAAALTGSFKKVYVAAGTYGESVSLTGGVSLYGGFSAADWSDRDRVNRSNATYQTIIQGPGTSQSAIGVTSTSTGDSIVEGFTIQSTHANNSYAVNIYDVSATVRYNTIDGGPGDNESNGIYIHGDNAETVIEHNMINGGSSTSSTSNGIYIETSADQVITDNTIDGGSGANSSHGITITYPLASTSLIARNTINGGSNSNSTYAIAIYNNNIVGTSAPMIHSNDIDAGDGENCRGIFCYGSADGYTVAPIICNNIIKAVGTHPRALLFQDVDGSPLVYNNTISTSGTDQANVISSIGSVNQASSPDIRNNIIIGDSSLCVAFYEENNSNSLFSYIMNNDIYDCTCTIITAATAYFELTDLNGLRSGISANISVDPALDADLAPTVSTPISVNAGALDLSGVAIFPENADGDKIDKIGGDRTPGWTMGAYEID